jgi:hypothetical protein
MQVLASLLIQYCEAIWFTNPSTTASWDYLVARKLIYKSISLTWAYQLQRPHPGTQGGAECSPP